MANSLPRSNGNRYDVLESFGDRILHRTIHFAMRSKMAFEKREDIAELFDRVQGTFARGNRGRSRARTRAIDISIRQAMQRGWRRGDVKRIALDHGVSSAAVSKRRTLLTSRGS
jgi:hypothetical protein